MRAVPPRRTTTVLAVVAAAGALAAALVAAVAPGPAGPAPRAGQAAAAAPEPVHGRPGAPAARPGGVDLPHRLGTARRALRDAALRQVLADPAAFRGVRSAPAAVRLPGGEHVRLRPPPAARLFVVLVEFGDTVDPATGGEPGPRHGQIREPDRTRDTITPWQPSYEPPHYRDLFFGDGAAAPSLASYFREQSGGRFRLDGHVTDWVRVAANEARYGSGDCGGEVCPRVWDLVRDAMNAWYDSRLAAGLTPDQITAELREFDVEDRDDHDRDGDFAEPDGYLDHVEVVHAGVDKAAGGGAQGDGAIWSHRWYAYPDAATGPPGNAAGGTRVGASALWVGDYTMQPENGGAGLVAHEFAHDLGLPDLYDRGGDPETPTSFWTLMALGGYLGDGPSAPGVGTRPGALSAWDRLQLGWLDWVEADPAEPTTVTLAAEPAAGRPQAVLVRLPDRADPGPAGGRERWYIVENRQYTGADAALRTGPYEFTGQDDRVAHFAYGSGVLVWLWDTGHADNDISAHPGEGILLPVDAHPGPLRHADGSVARARLQVYDAAFTAAPDATDPLGLVLADEAFTVPSAPGTAVFDDRRPAWSPERPRLGVRLPAAGVTVTVDPPSRAGTAVTVTIAWA